MTKPRTQRLLVIERDVAVARMICRFLAPAGYLVHETQNYDGLLLTGDRRYDLVLASPASLEPSFLDIVKQIKKAGVPLLLMTGGVEQDAIAEALSSGAYGPLPKPFDPKSLVAMIRNILR